MDIFYNAAVVWFVAGFVFFILEFVLPGLILFFFAVGAWITAVACMFLDISLDAQLIIFGASSVLTILLFRKGVKKILYSRKQNSEIEDEFIGKTGRAETMIGPGRNGKVSFKGTSWDAKSDEMIESGDEVIVIGNESILLIVKSTKSAV